MTAVVNINIKCSSFTQTYARPDMGVCDGFFFRFLKKQHLQNTRISVTLKGVFVERRGQNTKRNREAILSSEHFSVKR